MFNSNINTNIFTEWIQQDLLPKLPAGSVIVMDNAAFHKQQQMQTDIINAGHIIEYLPPYSPDLNKIEHKWAQAKKIRKLQQCTVPQIFLNEHL